MLPRCLVLALWFHFALSCLQVMGLRFRKPLSLSVRLLQSHNHQSRLLQVCNQRIRRCIERFYFGGLALFFEQQNKFWFSFFTHNQLVKILFSDRLFYRGTESPVCSVMPSRVMFVFALLAHLSVINAGVVFLLAYKSPAVFAFVYFSLGLQWLSQNNPRTL